jgi:hypothetical protein
MGYRELFLVLVSVVLLSMLMTQINSNTVEGREALQQLELEHTAAAIAQQFIEEARAKDFDALVGVIPATAMPGGFTPWDNLGPGADVYPQYDDVDDYHNFSRNVYVNGTNFNVNDSTGVPFNVSIQVAYVSPVKPDSAVLHETFLKRMTVTVSSNYIPSNVIIKHVFSYYGVNL